MAVATVAALVATAGVGAAGADPPRAPAAVPAPQPGDRQVTRHIATEAGLQVVRKHRQRPTVRFHGTTVAAPNPYVALTPDPASVDWSFWRTRMARKGAQRQQERQSGDRRGADRVPVPTAYAYVEQEPSGTRGHNDTQANAERLTRFGINREFQAVRVLGGLVGPDVDAEALATVEDQGAIPLATATGIHAQRDGVEVDSRIGNGPHGSSGTGSGDFDFFRVNAVAGESISANTAGSGFDTMLVVYNAAGEIVAANDDANGTLQSDVIYDVPVSGRYFVMVAGFFSLPANPFDSGSGEGAGDEGNYHLVLTAGLPDRDHFAVRLHPGDVLAGTLAGSANRTIAVNRVDGESMVGSGQDASFLYPVTSPLPAGDATFAYVAEEGGWYSVSARRAVGAYRMLLEVYRPGTELEPAGTVQKVFLDFNGARTNTAIFGGFGVVTLAPLRSFMAGWGLPASATGAVIDEVVATVRQNIKHRLREQGLNDRVRVKVRNSRDHRDRFGRPNVSRVIVGGTIEQSGVFTIGVAQSIDPGNYGHEETALLLLDLLSDPDPDQEFADVSLNTYITRASDRIGFIGQALGNVAAHEVGHFIGSYHVDQFNEVPNLMDQGGNFPVMYGVGPDGVGGTRDDVDVDFGEDTYNPGEGFTGLEDTLNNSAWGFVGGR